SRLGDGAVHRREVQFAALVRMRSGGVFVELDAETGRVRWDQIAVFPAERRFQERRREAAPVEDALEQEEVPAAGGELDVGRADDRPAVEMRRDLRVGSLCERRDLLPFEQSARAAEVRLQDRGGAG